MSAVIAILVVLIYPITLLSNFFFYQKFPRERWPMVMVATLLWFVPITGLGLWWGVVPLWFIGAEALCLVSAFFATMTLKFVVYRKAAFEEGGQLAPWQRDMLADVDYSLGQQARHLESASADRLELERLLHRMQERQTALDEAIRQMDLYRRIGQQTLDDFKGDIVSCYLARRQQAEGDVVREEAHAAKDDGL